MKFSKIAQMLIASKKSQNPMDDEEPHTIEELNAMADGPLDDVGPSLTDALMALQDKEQPDKGEDKDEKDDEYADGGEVDVDSEDDAEPKPIDEPIGLALSDLAMKAIIDRKKKRKFA